MLDWARVSRYAILEFDSLLYPYPPFAPSSFYHCSFFISSSYHSFFISSSPSLRSSPSFLRVSRDTRIRPSRPSLRPSFALSFHSLLRLNESCLLGPSLEGLSPRSVSLAMPSALHVDVHALPLPILPSSLPLPRSPSFIPLFTDLLALAP